MTEESEALQAIIDANDQPIFALDRELRYTAFNRAHSEVMRALYGAEIARGGRLPDYQTVETDRQVVLANLDQALAGDRFVASAYSGEPGRERRDFDVAHIPLRDKGGAVNGVVVRAIDVTPRHRAENGLRASEERYGLLFENMLEGCAYCRMLYDDEGRPDDFVYLTVNPAFERLTRLVDVVGKRVTEVIPTIRDETPELFGIYGRVAETGEPTEFEIDFTPLGLRLRVSVFRPEPDHFVAVFSDVTESKRAEAELESERREYATIFDASPVMIVYKSKDDHVLRVNDAFARFIGLPKDKIIGMTTFDIANPKETAQLSRADDIEVVRSGTPRLNQLVFFSSPFSDSAAWVLFSKLPFRDSSGEAVGTVSFVTDVNDRKLAEDALESSTERLRRTLSGAVSALSATVEMRDPYTAGHERRVAQLAAAIAAELGWSPEAIAALHTAAIIHDLGKVVVPAEILSKPGRLSEAEMKLVQEHPQAGADTVAQIDFGAPIPAMIRQHHERLDGSGYPAGLKAEQIMPEARILAVADVVEAMISHRPYRAALPLEATLAEIEDGAGSRYDEAACEAAVTLFRERGFTFSE